MSGTFNQVRLFAESFDDLEIAVFDSKSGSIGYGAIAIQLAQYREQGMSFEKLKQQAEKLIQNTYAFFSIDTLEFLQKGGRIGKATAFVGTALKIKPILTIQGEKLDSFQKTRTMIKARQIMIDAVLKDLKDRIDPNSDHFKNTRLMIAYTYDQEQALEFKKQVEEIFPNHEIICDPLSLSVACHIGPHSLALAACKKLI